MIKLAVAPEWQNKGCGSVLAKFVALLGDTDRVPIYLETEGPRNEQFYREKAGFRLVEKSPVFSQAGIFEFDGGAKAMIRDAEQ